MKLMKLKQGKFNLYDLAEADQTYVVSNDKDKTVSLLFVSQQVTEVDEVLGGSQVQIKMTRDQFHDLRNDVVKLPDFV